MARRYSPVLASDSNTVLLRCVALTATSPLPSPTSPESSRSFFESVVLQITYTFSVKFPSSFVSAFPPPPGAHKIPRLLCACATHSGKLAPPRSTREEHKTIAFLTSEAQLPHVLRQQPPPVPRRQPPTPNSLTQTVWGASCRLSHFLPSSRCCVLLHRRVAPTSSCSPHTSPLAVR